MTKREYHKQWRELNKEHLKAYRRKRYHENKTKLAPRKKRAYDKVRQAEYDKNKRLRAIENGTYEEYKKKKALYVKNKRLNDPLFKLKGNIRNLIKNSFRYASGKKDSRTYEILGCTYDEFKMHLESQFKEGMSWDNLGKWHIDHKKPVSLATNEQEVYELNHYTNLQPLWAKDNLQKSNKL